MMMISRSVRRMTYIVDNLNPIQPTNGLSSESSKSEQNESDISNNRWMKAR